MGRERRHFTDEFKREAVALLVSGGRPLVRIAGEPGISLSMLRNGRHRQGGGNTGAAVIAKPAAPSVPDPAAELSRLRGENDCLRLARDISKKAVAIFPEPPG